MAFKKIAQRIKASPEFKKMMGSSGAAKEKESGSPTAGDAKAAQMIAEKMSGPARGRRPARRGLKTMVASMAAKPAGMKKGGMADKEGRAMKRKTADTKGRAMKKGK